MYKITSKAKHGGIWNGNRVVKVLETENDAEAEKFRAQGCSVEKVEVQLSDMTAAQLKKYAKEHMIDLGDATKKEEILAIIEAVQQE